MKMRKIKTVFILLFTLFAMGMLSACGKEKDIEVPAKVFGVDYSQEQELSSTIQVVCNAESAWSISTIKNDPIYKWSPQALGMGTEQIEWQPEEGNFDLINIAERQGMLYAEMRNRENNILEIRKCGQDGNWSSVISIRVDNWEDYIDMGNAFFVDSSENVYLVGRDGVTRFGGNVQEGKNYKLKGIVCLWSENDSGNVECMAATAEEITLYELKENGAAEEWTLKVSAQEVHGIQSGSEETLCLATNQEILFLDKESGSLLARTDTMKLGVHSVLAGYYDESGGVLQLYSLAGTDTEKLQYSVLSERDTSAEQRTEIIYGMVCGVNRGDTSSIWRAIAAFNQSSNEYYVTIRDYYNNTDRLHADMAAGNGPDVIDMTYSEYYESYVKNGYLEDLSPYLDQSQYKDDIIWNILDTFRIGDGLYIFTPQVQLRGVAIHPEYETAIEEWNMKSFLDMVEQNQWEKAPVGGQVGNPQMLLSFLLSGRQDEFIDWEQKKAAFESEEFVNLLELCKEYAERDWSYAEEQTYEEQKRNILCQEIYLGWNFTTYLSHVDVYGREYPLYGYPTLYGQTYVIAACPDSCAIYSGSSRKEGAWAFIESLLWDSNQKFCGIANPGLPVRGSMLKEVAEESKEMPVRSDGEMLTITDAEIYIVEEIFYHGKLCNGVMDYDIWTVITEETAPYFAGDKSAEDVARIIQSRVGIILQE
ncbi:MAG: carbohydrate ABC transporter substrate-binding protein [Lachnospiraceae bacterium]|nr:carbohydrate ABC transporter substrate-binding protein [Lachnospiraceae bacterium]